MKQKKVCSHEYKGVICGKVFYCNQECGLEKGRREDFCFCAKHYVESFYDGDVEEFKNDFKTKKDFCVTRLAQIIGERCIREKVEFT